MLLNTLDSDEADEISDELESFFHVIVYHAVRYLKSNLNTAYVADFIDEYFNTFRYQWGTCQWGCGYHKQNVIHSGDLRTSDRKKFVKFGRPLDNVLDTLLRWFRSHYAVQEYTNDLEERQRASPTSPTPASSAPSALHDDDIPVRRLTKFLAMNKNWKRPRAHSTNSETSMKGVDHDVSRHVRPPTQEQYDLAAKVKTHDEFMRLLDNALSSKQKNRRDPTGDRYPKD